MVIYTAVAGDTVGSVAEQYGVSPEIIIAGNSLDSASLVTGQSLVIRFPALTYTVEPGDTLNAVAERFGVSTNELWQNNPRLMGGDTLNIGDELVIEFEPPTLGSITLGGYAYPYINDTTLRRTLPYLTNLSVFAYGLRPDGSLVVPEGEERLINTAREYGAVPLLMLTSLTEGGTFSNELVNSILADEALTARVVANTVDNVISKGYGGVELDFEYISSEYAPRYAALARSLKAALGDDYVVFCDLAPKTSASQGGLLYESHNYAALGDACDKVFLMTYEWGYQYGPPMAVSPIENVRRVIEYAVTEIPPEKIFMGLPSYGYDWRLPYERGITVAEPVSNKTAIDLARRVGAEIQYDEEAQAPFFTYTDEGGAEHIVWFQDARSAEALASLAAEYSLDGIGVWNIMRWFGQLWPVLTGLYNIRK